MPEDNRSDTPPTAVRPRLRVWILGLAAAVLLVIGTVLWWVAWSRETVVERIEVPSGVLAGWNVVLVSLDTVRRDRIRCYGYDKIDTPVIDRLAREGIRFDQAVSPVPMTLPGHATMLTGLNPPRHGARVNGMFRLDRTVPTLQEVLRKQGYRTGAVISAFVLDRRFGLSRGFDDYDDDLSSGRSTYEFSYRERPGDQVTDVAAAWLRRNAANRFFLFVHYFDPHWPYAAPEPFAGRYKKNPHGDYDGEIAFADHQLGRLLAVLEEIKVRHRTLVIVTSDHGEGLDEHDEQTHSFLLYDTTLRVPLIFSGPPVLPRRRLIGRQVGLVDIAPTVLDLLGVPPDTGMDGVSLLAPPGSEPRAIYLETLGGKFMHGWAPMVGVRREDYKLVVAPQSELYDLRADPGELKNLYAVDRRTAMTMHDVLKRMVGQDPELVGEVAANLPVDQETRDKLGLLGYVITTTGPASVPATQRRVMPDPKEMIRSQRSVHEAQTLMHEGQMREALLLLEKHIEKHPRDVVALNAAGECYRSLGMLSRALETFRRAAESPYEQAISLTGVASVLVLMGEPEQAETYCRRALAIDASCVGAVLMLGMVRFQQDRDPEALELFERAIREGRGSFTAAAYSAIARLHHARGRTTEARHALDRALAADPHHPEATALLATLGKADTDKLPLIAKLRAAVARRSDPGVLFELGRLEAQTGQLDAAEATFRQLLAKQPDHAGAHLNLAQVLQRLNRGEDALVHLREAVRLGPGDPEAAMALGMALARMNRLEEARNPLERAAALAPNAPIARYNLGLVLARLNQLSRAAAEFREAIALKPDYAEAHYNLGVALQMMGMENEATVSLRRAAELDPNLAPAASRIDPSTMPAK